MKGTKQQKGITLVALIITIVVLLILAVVAVSSLTNGDIIGHAENSAKTYNNSVKNEADILGGYLDYLEDATRCKHVFPDEWEIKTQATCTADGQKQRACTKNCGTTETETIPMLGHTPDDEERYCEVCSECVHSYMHRAEDPSHTPLGPEGHTWMEVCANCWYVYDEGTTSHYFYDGYCQACGYYCEHPNATYTYEGKSKNDLLNYGDHAVLLTCPDCDLYNSFVSSEKCTYENGKCTKCEDNCSHMNGFTDGICNGCGSACQHTYNGDNWDPCCTKCGAECPHDGGTTQFYDGEDYKQDGFHHHSLFVQCNICNYYVSLIGPDAACACFLGADGKCSVCGGENIHNWNEEGTCYSCWTVCSHNKGYTNGNCNICGMTCAHETFSNGACTACGYGCDHPNGFTDGKCPVCEYTCDHTRGEIVEDATDKWCNYCWTNLGPIGE